jgi:hypothetical protein
MNSPAPNAGKPRKLWPWFLGGCLLLVLLGVVALVAVGWFGMKMMGDATRKIVAEVPLVEEHFGKVTDAGMDFGGMGSQPGAMVFRIVGEKGEGRLVITLDPSTSQFQSATLILPNGEEHALDQRTLEQLQALQTGGIPKG